MDREPGAADFDRLLDLAGAAALLGKLRKRNRRRVLLDPASKIFDPLVVGHECYGTVIACVADPVRPRSSVTRRVTV